MLRFETAGRSLAHGLGEEKFLGLAAPIPKTELPGTHSNRNLNPMRPSPNILTRPSELPLGMFAHDDLLFDGELRLGRYVHKLDPDSDARLAVANFAADLHFNVGYRQPKADS
jgi:hypothetical protein